MNKQNTSIQFTKEIEENGKIPLLDCLVTRENNTLRTTVQWKPTLTDRLLDQTSYNPTSHKATTVRTMTRRAQIVCDSDDSLTDKTKHLNSVFIKFNYRLHRTQFLHQTERQRQQLPYEHTHELLQWLNPYVFWSGFLHTTTENSLHKMATDGQLVCPSGDDHDSLPKTESCSLNPEVCELESLHFNGDKLLC